MRHFFVGLNKRISRKKSEFDILKLYFHADAMLSGPLHFSQTRGIASTLGKHMPSLASPIE